MTPYDFKNSWTNTDEPLSPIARIRLNRFDLLQSTVDFLTQAGLPVYCEPNLYFTNDSDDLVYGINKLTDQYAFEADKEKYEKYIVIGSCRDGNAIAIDTADSDKILELDHEDSFNSIYFNSSLATLADFLILYRDFEKEVLKDKDPDDEFQCFNFTDQQFDELKKKMLLIDKKAITERSFWNEEFEIMLALRGKYFGTA
ncbi:MAG: SUKH-4 family immunity protein [Bacteroidetes bacterium]|nr:SUKH-4 family immunity protein [Bacteroidota bacterium]